MQRVYRDFEIFKKAVLDFCGVQSLAEAKGLGSYAFIFQMQCM